MPTLDAALLARLSLAVSEVREGHRLLAAEAMEGGISATMVRLEVETPSGDRTRWVGRLPGDWSVAHDPNGSQRMATLLGALRTSGIPCPEPIGVETHDRPFLFMEYLEGAPRVQTSDWPAFGRAVAERLAAIHTTRLPDTIALRGASAGRKRPESGNPSLREDEVWDALQDLVPGRETLVHGDFWPGNLIWRDDELVGVVDWEEAHVGDPLCDVGISRLDMLWVGGWVAVEAFTQRYFECVQTESDLSQYDLRAALRPMENLAEWASAYPKLGRPDITEAYMAERLLAFIENALQYGRNERRSKVN